MEERDQKDLLVSNEFGFSTYCSTTYILKVGARVSLKVATKVCLIGTKFQKLSKSEKSKNGVVQPKRLIWPL